MNHDTYSIESQHGQTMSEGIQNTLANVLAMAQEDADRLGETVYVYNQDGDQWEIEPEDSNHPDQHGDREPWFPSTGEVGTTGLDHDQPRAL